MMILAILTRDLALLPPAAGGAVVTFVDVKLGAFLRVTGKTPTQIGTPRKLRIGG